MKEKMMFTDEFMAIVKEIKKGNVLAYDPRMEIFYKECKERVKELSKKNRYRFYGSWEQDDYVQVAVMDVLKAIPQYDEQKSFEGYCNAVINNVYRKMYRCFKDEKYKLVSIDEEDENGKEKCCMDNVVSFSGAEAVFMRNKSWNDVWALVETLPENYQQVFKLCYVMRMKSSDAAEMLNCTSHDISNWKNRVGKRLRKYIEDNEMYDELITNEYAA